MADAQLAALLSTVCEHEQLKEKLEYKRFYLLGFRCGRVGGWWYGWRPLGLLCQLSARRGSRLGNITLHQLNEAQLLCSQRIKVLHLPKPPSRDELERNQISITQHFMPQLYKRKAAKMYARNELHTLIITLRGCMIADSRNVTTKSCLNQKYKQIAMLNKRQGFSLSLPG